MQAELFDPWPRVQNAIETADNSVMRDETAEKLVAILTEWATHQLTVSGDDLGARLDAMGVPRDNALRRRLVSVVINRMRGRKAIESAGKIMGRAGRDITLWRVV